MSERVTRLWSSETTNKSNSILSYFSYYLLLEPLLLKRRIMNLIIKLKSDFLINRSYSVTQFLLSGTKNPSRRGKNIKKFICYKLIQFSKTADSDTVSTYQVSSVQLVTNKKLEAFNKA